MSNQRIQHDYYKILGVKKNATQSEVKQAYRILIGLYHPDRQDINQDNTSIFLINEAYETLKNPTKRAKYDTQHTLYFDAADMASSTWEMIGTRVGRFFRQAEQHIKQGLQQSFDTNARMVITSWERFKEQVNPKQKPPTLTICLDTALTGGQVSFTYKNQKIKTTFPKGLYQGAMVKLTMDMQAVWFMIQIQSTPVTYVDKKDIHHTHYVYPWQVAFNESFELPFSGLSVPLPSLDNLNTPLKIAKQGIPSVQGESAGDLYVYFVLALPKVTTLTDEQRAAFLALKDSFKDV